MAFRLNALQKQVTMAAIALMAFGQTIGSAQSIQGPSEGTEITVYNQNFALVKDQRMINLDKGINSIRFTDVAAQIDPTSVHFKSLTAPSLVTILEQNYQYDLISPEKILEKYIGQEVIVRTQELGSEKVTQGTLLSAQGPNSLVIQTKDGIVLGAYGTIELAKLPEGLISKPTLFWMINSGQAGTHRSEISYITNGLNWQADYVVVVNKTDDKVDLSGWVTLDNKSGASYQNTSLKLIAGDVHRVQDYPQFRDEANVKMFSAKAVAPQFDEKSFFEYHMYSLDRKTNLASNETKQLSLLTAADVPASKVYIYEGAPYRYYGGDSTKKVKVMVELVNSKLNNLGMPLPKGKVRVYKVDDDGAQQFVGEDTIDHTPRDEKVRLYLGDAFDLVGERNSMELSNISGKVQEETIQVKLRNHKDVPVDIKVVEHSWSDWKILESNFKYYKKDAQTFEFPIKVSAGGEQVLTYRIQRKTQ
jgi:hypothetical protein